MVESFDYVREKFGAGLSEKERESLSGIVTAVEAHTGTLTMLQENHMSYAAEIEKQTQNTFHHRYMVNQIIANLLTELFRKESVS